MKQGLVGFLSGLVFATGLALSGMTRPSKVTGFLDVAGHWDPTLAFVMVGGIGTFGLAWRFLRGWDKPLLGAGFHLPTRKALDARLLGGAAIFGVGWGVGGYCPGPAVASLGAGSWAALVFVAAMALGLAVVPRPATELADERDADCG